MSSEVITRNDLIAILRELGHPFSPLDYYPIGSYFWTSESSYNPNSSMGGTWELMDEGITLVSAGETYTIQSGTSADGGEAEVTLTVDEMPSHTHIQNSHRHDMGGNWSSGSGSGTAYMTSSKRAQTTHYTSYETPTNQNTGGGQPHENMPPYKAAYCWHRTA